jgi:hypothetical protein
MKPQLTACVDTPLGLSMSSNAVAKPSIRTLVRAVGPALVRLCGVLLGSMAAVCVAFWLGIMFEGDIAFNSDRYHVDAFCFAMAAIAPLGWWLLFWTGPFRGRGWAGVLAWVLPLVLPIAWVLPTLASIPGILIYNLGRRLSR